MLKEILHAVPQQAALQFLNSRIRSTKIRLCHSICYWVNSSPRWVARCVTRINPSPCCTQSCGLTHPKEFSTSSIASWACCQSLGRNPSDVELSYNSVVGIVSRASNSLIQSAPKSSGSIVFQLTNFRHRLSNPLQCHFPSLQKES